MKIGINFCCVLAILSADALSLNANVTVPDSVAEPGVEQMDTLVVESNGEPEINSLFQLGSNVPTHLNVAAPAKKRPWLAGAEVVAEDLLFHVLTRYLIKEDYAQISWSSIKNNFKTGLLWDNDKFETNLFSHPYQGNLYYSSARSNGLNFWESAPYALLGSSIWEWFMETQPASINDIMSTTFGGMALGETTYRLSSLALNGFVSGVALGGALCDYYQFHDRDYNMGSGYSIRLNGLFTLQRRFGIYLGFENYHIFTWKGYEHKDYENMNPHYLDAQGAVGDARLQMMNLRGSFAISPKVGISAETAWCRRKSHYKYFPDVLSDTFEFRLMFSYHI